MPGNHGSGRQPDAAGNPKRVKERGNRRKYEWKLLQADPSSGRECGQGSQRLWIELVHLFFRDESGENRFDLCANRKVNNPNGMRQHLGQGLGKRTGFFEDGYAIRFVHCKESDDQTIEIIPINDPDSNFPQPRKLGSFHYGTKNNHPLSKFGMPGKFH